MTYNKQHASDLLSKSNDFHGMRSTDEKVAADNACYKYLNEHFDRVTSDTISKMPKSEYRYVIHEMTMPENLRGNLAEYAGQQVHIVFLSKNRNGRQSAYIRIA